MAIPAENFLKHFGQAMEDSAAALFVGAGVSVAAGFVNWKELLREVADELGLVIDRETDLVTLAQYHVNTRRTRTTINRKLIQEFTEGAAITDTHRLLAQLPIATVWTTNYDSLLEQAYESAGRRVDVKRAPADLSTTRPRRDATIYKMHGDAMRPDQAVLTKDDYERYHNTHQGFVDALRGALVEKSFLFLGFSFTDPNVGQILARIRLLQGDAPREHYWIERRVPGAPEGAEPEVRAEQTYLQRRQALQLEDLQRYGIQAVLVDEYSDIPKLLAALVGRARGRTTFVSGSAHDYGGFGHSRMEELARLIGRRIIASDHRLISGFGLGIAGAVLVGAWEEIYASENVNREDQVVIRPFPQNISDPEERRRKWTAYRQALLKHAGFAVFLAGNKLDASSGSVLPADGVREEFEVARNQGAYPIPVGATGFVARELWQRVLSSTSDFFPGIDVSGPLTILGEEDRTNEELVEAIFEIIKRVNQGGFTPSVDRTPP